MGIFAGQIMARRSQRLRIQAVCLLVILVTKFITDDTIFGGIFITLTNLRHLRSHGNIQLACDGCGSVYKRSDALFRHAKTCMKKVW
jgi:hypothetical protein